MSYLDYDDIPGFKNQKVYYIRMPLMKLNILFDRIDSTFNGD